MPRQLTPELRQISLEAHEWVTLLEEPPVSGETRAAFDAWLAKDPRHKDEFKKAQMSVAASHTLQVDDFPGYQPTSKVMLLRSYAMEGIDFFLDRKGWSFGVGGLVAAGIAAAVLLSPGPTPLEPHSSPFMAAYQSEIGQLKTIALSDGTQVTLGGRSAITAEYYTDRRLVTLTQGKAYFDVVPDADRPFVVATADLTATAVGTAFDVRNNGEVFRVGVTEGQVDVDYPFVVGGKELGSTLTKSITVGQEVVATTQSGLQKPVDISTNFIAAWRDDRLVYQNVTIAELIVDLNRYSETPIEVDPNASEILALQFGGVFPEKNIDAVLKMLTDIHPIEVDRSDPQTIILRNLFPYKLLKIK